MGKNYIKIGQITDLHMMDTEDSAFHGCLPYLNFKNVISDIQYQDCDLVILTGDISESGTIESYQLVKQILDTVPVPKYIIPGNHDNIANMNLILKEYLLTSHSVMKFGLWDICYLDTIVPHENHGFLSDKGLIEFKQVLSACKSPNIIILTHHQPRNVGTPLIDQFNIINSEKLNEIDLKNKGIALFIFGHVHNDYSLLQGNKFFSSAPACCFQFKKGAEKLDLDAIFGYKIYKLYDDFIQMDTKWL